MRKTLLILVLAAGALSADAAPAKRWTEQFNLSNCSWASIGSNDYFVLQPGYQQTLDGRDGKDVVHLEVTVLGETKTVAGVETRIIEERESRNGSLVEVSRNYFAVCAPMNDVFYFGEDVDMYKMGKVTSHDGSWLAGVNGAKAGLYMPARPLIGARFYQEVAPNVAMDRSEVENDSLTLKTPAGEFMNCVKTEETTPLEPDSVGIKTFAKGIGLVQDGDLLLSKYGRNK